jgi:hypothetical protein
MTTTPISDAAATERLASAEVALEATPTLTDSELLSFPTIGRRTLAWIRAQELLQAVADGRASEDLI